jgi:hypothetical protein
VTLFDLPVKKQRIQELENMQMEAGFWDDPNRAQVYIRECNGLKKSIVLYRPLYWR